MDEITRRKDTGQPGNGGQFASTPRADSGLNLALSNASPLDRASRVLDPVRERLVRSHDRKTGGWCKAHSDHGQEPCEHPALCDVAHALDNLPGEPHGTMRSWMQAAAGRRVHTVQVDNRDGKAWAPTSRLVDASRTGHVTLDGSRRDYAGMRVLGSNPTTLVVEGNDHTVVYVLDSE